MRQPFRPNAGYNDGVDPQASPVTRRRRTEYCLAVGFLWLACLLWYAFGGGEVAKAAAISTSLGLGYLPRGIWPNKPPGELLLWSIPFVFAGMILVTIR